MFGISFNENVKKEINLSIENNTPYIASKEKLSILNMQTNKKHITDTIGAKNEFKKMIYQYRGYKFVLKDFYSKAKISYISKKENSKDILIFKVNDKKIEVAGKKGVIVPYDWDIVNNLNVGISYGAKKINLPFSLTLDKFILDKYPGSKSPKSYESIVTLTDEGKQSKHRIYMNNTLKVKGYKFFQSSYDADGKGTVLSVNYDTLGTLVSYIGYLLMTLGMIITLFSNNRFGNLIKSLSKNKVVVLIGILLSFSSLTAGEINKSHSDKFGKILIQDPQGRIEPINTLATEILRKVYGGNTYKGLDANQVFYLYY